MFYGEKLLLYTGSTSRRDNRSDFAKTRKRVHNMFASLGHTTKDTRGRGDDVEVCLSPKYSRTQDHLDINSPRFRVVVTCTSHSMWKQ